MYLKQIEVGEMENFAYLLACDKSRQGCVIDPGFEADTILAHAQKDNISLKQIFNTHFHYDHITDNAKIIEATHAKLVAHEQDAPHINPPPDITVKDGDRFTLGQLTLQIIHTPGHSQGGICLLAGNNLFTGDTLFIDGAGRCDLPGGDSQVLNQSLQKIKQMNGNIVIYPGHHYSQATSALLKEVKETNYALKFV